MTTIEPTLRPQEFSSEPIDVAVIEFALETLAADGLLEPSTLSLGSQRGDSSESYAKVRPEPGDALPVVTALLVATPEGPRLQLGPRHDSCAATPPPPSPPERRP